MHFYTIEDVLLLVESSVVSRLDTLIVTEYSNKLVVVGCLCTAFTCAWLHLVLVPGSN